MKSIQKIIEKRTSIRTYTSQLIEKSKKDELNDFISGIVSGPFGNKVKFKFIELDQKDINEMKSLGTYGMIRGAYLYLVGTVEKGNMCFEDFGYCMEKIILKATDMGLGTCWIGASFDKSKLAKRIMLSVNEYLPAISPIGYESDKQNLKTNIMQKVLNVRKRKSTKDLFYENNSDSPISDEFLNKYKNIFESVRLGPSAGNLQPWRIILDKTKNIFHFYMNEIKIYNNMFRGVHLQNLDMGIAMFNFEAVALESGLKGEWKNNKPEINSKNWVYIASYKLGDKN
jgi:nitroreductase